MELEMKKSLTPEEERIYEILEQKRREVIREYADLRVIYQYDYPTMSEEEREVLAERMLIKEGELNVYLGIVRKCFGQ